MTRDDGYSTRTYQDGSDMPAKSHFFDEMEEAIHGLIVAFGENCASFRQPADPGEGQLAIWLCEIYTDYYYDASALPEAVRDLRHHLESVDVATHLGQRLPRLEPDLGRLERILKTRE